jgi:murein L,D-transpeptidase YcbB/YkuD
VAGIVRNRLEVLRGSGFVSASGERIRARIALPDFYLARGWVTAWSQGDGPNTCARRLVAFLEGVAGDGLEPDDYHLERIRALLEGGEDRTWDAGELADLDLLLTDAFLTVGSHLHQGRVNPETLEAEWLANRRQLDMARVLDDALARGDVEGVLADLRPSQPGYRALRDKLEELREVEAAGGWGRVPTGPTLHPGDEDARVEALRLRLRASGDLSPDVSEEGVVLDPVLAAAVARFQRRHGLDPDSVVGVRTVEALNVPVEDRIRQVAVNLERWRWLPDDLGRVHIRVNIADYRVEVREEGDVVLSMRAVVGRAYRQTPMFSARMTHLVLAPYWHVPPGIAAADKLPELKRNPGYLAEQHMTLLDQATNEPVDPATVDFASLTGAQFNRRYRIRQDPGPLNALGKVKFMFPNRHNVYLHDTPSRELFARTERAFSSGCIRVQRPLELADYLLRMDPAWPPERIREVAGGAEETTVRLAEPVPVHILYWTAFVDEDGLVNFRPDLYQRDTRVRRALEDEPPEL